MKSKRPSRPTITGVGCSTVFVVVEELARAGCTKLYLDGSYVTGKEHPVDYDGCWDPVCVDGLKLDPVLLDFSNKRAAQKLKYRGEMFPLSGIAAPGRTFLEFFQVDKHSGKSKGIIALDLSSGAWKQKSTSP